jgi:hypothetical protein
MQYCQLSDGGSGPLGDSAPPPVMHSLTAELKLDPNDFRADVINQLAVSMSGLRIPRHGRTEYQQNVDTSSLHSFMESACHLSDKLRMTFGERLKKAIKEAGYRNQRRFAIDALGWDDASGPQRLGNYITKNRIPDEETLRHILSKLKVSREELLNEGTDDALRDILIRLFELEDIPPDKADTIATVFLEAKRLLATYPDEGEPQTRARLAAHSAWHRQPPQGPRK